MRGELTPGFPAVIRWQDGEWTSSEDVALQSIKIAILLGGPTVCQSPTGPCFPVDSEQGARLLAVVPFKTIATIESDIDLPELESVPGRVYGPLSGPNPFISLRRT